jgi:hypothetical protein
MVTGYDVILPQDSLKKAGRSYQDLAEANMQWLVSENPDDHNDAEVVFLRGMDFPGADENITYSFHPATMVGDRSLNIMDIQYLFLPVVFTCATDIDDRAMSVQERNYLAWRDTREGDSPPSVDQVRIDGKSVNLGARKLDLSDFLVYTRDFTLRVPTVPYGKSLKDFFDIPMAEPGDRQASIGGYFILFKFKSHVSPEIHTLSFEAQGVRGPKGLYLASGLYTINVSPTTNRIFTTGGIRPHGIGDSFKDRMRALIKERNRTGRIGANEYGELVKNLK